MLKAIVWQERYACNFKCPYCAIYSKKQEGSAVSAQQWIDAFNKLKPRTLDITGGEPFLNKDLVSIINGLDSSIFVGLTTNLSQPILDFVQKVSPSKVISMTLSYHPSQTGITKDWFVAKAVLLASRGFNINVNFVAYPEQMFLIPSIKQMCENFGIRFHVDPFAQGGNELFQYTPAEKEFLAHFVDSDRSFRLGCPDRLVMCSAGQDYLQVDPDGTAHRCMSYQFQKRQPVGNILDKDFQLLSEPCFCDTGDQCGGCDRDKATITKPTVAL